MTDDNTKAQADGESQAQEDPMAEIAAALREIMKDLPPRQYRRVGWRWWAELQGEDPEPDEDDIWSDLFDRSVEEVFGNKRQEKIETGEAELR